MAKGRKLVLGAVPVPGACGFCGEKKSTGTETNYSREKKNVLCNSSNIK